MRLHNSERTIARSLLLVITASCAFAQSGTPKSKTSPNSGVTVRRHTAPTDSSARATSLVDKAEDAITRQDFAGAESLLKAALAADEKDYRGWYDLGYVY